MPASGALLLLLLLTTIAAASQAADDETRRTAAAANVEKAHAEIWRRFVDSRGILLDFTDLDGKVPLPTAEECRQSKPNALAWWTPIENGAMFNGMYIDAAINRWKLTGKAEDREKVRRLADGLMFLAGVGKTTGFIARGVADDGVSHYPMGSNDQTSPWFYGLWRYVRSGIPTEALERAGWKMPCDATPFTFRGGFNRPDWESGPRLLFLTRALHDLTGDARWEERYRHYLHQPEGTPSTTRLAVCATGMVFHGRFRHSWTGVNSVLCLRALWEMETDEAVKAEYLKGLRASAILADTGIDLHRQYENDTPTTFDTDWRRLNEWWKPQATEAEAVAVAEAQSSQLNRLSPRRPVEFTLVREPLFAAWVASLCPNREVVAQYVPKIEQALAHYRYDKLYYSQFFAGECAWYQLRVDREKAGR